MNTCHALPASFRRSALSMAAAVALSSAPAAWADAVVGGFVYANPGGSFAEGTLDLSSVSLLLPAVNLYVGFDGRTGSLTLNGGTQASFQGVTTAGVGSLTTGPLPDFNQLRVQDAGTKLSMQGLSTGWGSGDIFVTNGGTIDGRTAACTNTSFNFFFCGTSIGSTTGSNASLEVDGAGSLYQTRSFVIARTQVAAINSGGGTPGGNVAASAEALNGGTIRSWNVTVGQRFTTAAPATGAETATGIMRVKGANSLWVVDGYNSTIDGPVPANFTAQPYVIVGTFAGNDAQLIIEDGGTLRLEKADASVVGAPFLIVGNGGAGQMRVSGAGSKVEFQTGLGGSLQVGRRAGGTSTLEVNTGGLVTGLQYLAVGRALYTVTGGVGTLDTGGSGTLVVDGAGSVIRLNDYVNSATTSSVGQLDIGRGAGATGTVTVRNGGKIEILGTVARPTGLSTYNGPNLIIGREAGDLGPPAAPPTFTGSATLNIQGAGSAVELRADNALNSVNPAVRVGRAGTGTGTLNVTGGGKLVIDGNAASDLATVVRTTSFIVGGTGGFNLPTAPLSGGNGNVLVSGVGSEILMKGNDLFASVGDGPGGNGQMTISNGGKFTGTLFQVGRVRTTGNGDTATGTLTMNGGQMLLSGQFNSTQSNAVVGASLSVGTDAGSTGIMTMSNGSTVQIQNTTLNRAASLFIGANPNFSGSTGSLVMTTGSSISIQGLAGSNLGVGATGTGSLTMNASSITMASNGQANINGSAQLSNGSLLDAGSFLGIAASGGTGSLLINNSEVKAAEIVIGAGGILGGSGATVTGNVTNYGIFSPGASPGRFTILGNYKAEAGSKLILEVESDGAGGFRSDEVIFGGTVDLAGLAIEFRFLGSTNLQAFANTGNFQIDHFLKKQGGGTLDDSSFEKVSFAATAGNMALEGFTFDPAVGIPAAVPEPQTWALMLLGLGALGSLARRRRAG